jgi:hypothetical protein
MQRKTFEETVRTIIANQRLGDIVMGDIPATESNWHEFALEAQSQADHSVQSLCADLRMVTGISIYPFAKFKINMWQGGGSLGTKAQWTFEQFLVQYPRYVNGTIKNISCSAKKDIIYPIHPLIWRKTDVYTVFPNGTGQIRDIHLKNPEEYTGTDIPIIFKKKLDLLKETTYDYQPYVLKDRSGDGMLLVLKLGNQWKDIVIASHDHPSSTKITMLFVFMMLICLMISWHIGKYLFTDPELHWSISLLLGTTTFITFFFGVLIATFLVCKNFGTMRI